VSWRQFPGGNPMNEGLLSGSLDIVSGGTTVFVTLWAKAKGSPQAVRSIGATSITCFTTWRRKWWASSAMPRRK